MDPDATLTLLRALLTAADAGLDATHLLHESVRLHRLDGVSLHGRADVLDAVVTRDRTARLSVHREHANALHVALEIVDVPGRLIFQMRAASMDGRLIEIWMEPPDVD